MPKLCLFRFMWMLGKLIFVQLVLFVLYTLLIYVNVKALLLMHAHKLILRMNNDFLFFYNFNFCFCYRNLKSNCDLIIHIYCLVTMLYCPLWIYIFFRAYDLYLRLIIYFFSKLKSCFYFNWVDFTLAFRYEQLDSKYTLNSFSSTVTRLKYCTDTTCVSFTFQDLNNTCCCQRNQYNNVCLPFLMMTQKLSLWNWTFLIHTKKSM